MLHFRPRNSPGDLLSDKSAPAAAVRLEKDDPDHSDCTAHAALWSVVNTMGS